MASSQDQREESRLGIDCGTAFLFSLEARDWIPMTTNDGGSHTKKTTITKEPFQPSDPRRRRVAGSAIAMIEALQICWYRGTSSSFYGLGVASDSNASPHNKGSETISFEPSTIVVAVVVLLRGHGHGHHRCCDRQANAGMGKTIDQVFFRP